MLKEQIKAIIFESLRALFHYPAALPDTVMCPTLSDPSNGAILMTNTTVGSVVSYTCSRGYRLDGPMTRECQSGGNWTGSDPVCSCKLLI